MISGIKSFFALNLLSDKSGFAFFVRQLRLSHFLFLGEDMDIQKNVGIVKEFDNLGRLVIPMEFKKRYCFEKDIEIVAVDEGVLIRNPEYVLVKKELP